MVALVGIIEIGAPPIGGPHTPPGAQGPAPARFGPAANQIVLPTAKEMIRKASLRMRMAPEGVRAIDSGNPFPKGRGPIASVGSRKKSNC